MTRSLPHFPYELIAPIRVEQIAITPYFRMMAVSPNAWRFIAAHPASLDLKIDVRNHLPELVGLENDIHQVLSGQKKQVTIASIQRDYHPDTSTEFYFNLHVRLVPWEGLSQQQLVIELEDVTPRLLLERSLVQYSNETALIHHQLQASQDYTQQVIDSMLDGVIVTSQSGKIRTINPSVQRILGFSQAELCEENIQHIIKDNRFIQQQRQTGRELAAERESAWPQLEVQARHRNGQLIDIECACTLIHSPIEGFQGIVYTFRDIRDRKAAQAQLTAQHEALIIAEKLAQKANQIKSDFIAMVSHEIRTPINAVIGMTELISDTPLNPEQTDYVSTIQTSSEILLSLINDILDFSKLESGHLAIAKIPFNIHESLQKTVSVFAHAAAQKQIKLRTNVHPSVPHIINSDSQRITQILINLLGNAVKFTSSGFISLDVSARRVAPSHDRHPESPEYEICFTVTDTGIGIESAQLQQLFQPFHQADSSITQRYGGTGLGLSISKRLTAMLGGTIAAASQLGRGSKFTFSIVTTAVAIPLVSQSTDQTSSHQRIAANAQSANPLRILVAEDNPINQKMLLTMLQQSGYAADLANNGIEVMTRLEQQPYDLILMDCQMPEMDGFEATRQIRQMVGRENWPMIVAITAQVQDDDRQRCLDVGMDDHLAKPMRLSNLHRILEQCIARPTAKSAINKPTTPVSAPIPGIVDAIDQTILDELRQIGGAAIFVIEMIDCYLQQSSKIIADIQAQLEAPDIGHIRQLAHLLHSSSATIGALQLAKQCREIERYAIDFDQSALGVHITALKDEWTRVYHTLQAELSRR
jgi:PAS domain S-box-containing protein